jgi:hypothetical protein
LILAIVGLLTTGGLLESRTARADEDRSPAKLSDQEAYEIAREAYIYAYPLVLHHLTMQVLTNFAEPTGIVGQGPFNRFSHSSSFPPADFKTVVRANVDTLYSVAWLDLGPEPLVLSVPAVDRYFLLQTASLWTDVFDAPGTGATRPVSFSSLARAGRVRRRVGLRSSTAPPASR